MFDIDHIAVTCERTGTLHQVSIALPVRYEALTASGDGSAIPLIVCLDAPWTFGTIVDATRVMSMAGEAPEAIVVGLSFVADSMSEYSRQRARWFTPTPWLPPPETGVRDIAADECGRALELGHMIREQVLPMIERDHPVGDRWFVGHSFSALAGLRYLFDDPSLFDRWILASPSIWWDDRAILAVEDDYAAANTDLPAQVVITAGTDEHLAPYNMAANAELLAERLRSRSYPNLRVTSAELDGATHTSTIGAAVSAGLRALHK